MRHIMFEKTCIPVLLLKYYITTLVDRAIESESLQKDLGILLLKFFLFWGGVGVRALCWVFVAAHKLSLVVACGLSSCGIQV